jgi:hypothetical protein
MRTVWMQQGRWSHLLKGKRFDYVDHDITDLRQLLKIMGEFY